MRKSLLRFSVFPLILLICFITGCKQQEEQAAAETKPTDNLQSDKIPQAVTDSLKTRFPMAEIQKWTEETEEGVVVYDIEFTQEGKKFEADIKADGTLANWEEAIETKDLPEAVSQAVETKYPGSTIREIMQITNVSDGTEALEGYEIVLQTPDMKEVEVTLDPDGKILEDSGEKKPEEK
jgi:uncharacterized membrane protein YkoI